MTIKHRLEKLENNMTPPLSIIIVLPPSFSDKKKNEVIEAVKKLHPGVKENCSFIMVSTGIERDIDLSIEELARQVVIHKGNGKHE